MKNVLKWIALHAPLLIWVSLAGSCAYKESRVVRMMQKADGLTWSEWKDRLTIRVKEKQAGERTYPLFTQSGTTGGFFINQA